MLLLSTSRAAARLNVARALLAFVFDEDPLIATSAVDALALGSPAVAPEVTAALATASTAPLRARLLAVLSLIGETSHIDGIRGLVASDDAAPWGGLAVVSDADRTQQPGQRQSNGGLSGPSPHQIQCRGNARAVGRRTSRNPHSSLAKIRVSPRASTDRRTVWRPGSRVHCR